MSDRSAIRVALFDLDGTLVETAPDLVAVANRLRAEEGLPPVAVERLRSAVSHGSAALIRRAFEGADADDAAADETRFVRRQRRFLDLYDAYLLRAPTLFPGMAALLTTLERRGLRWGVVTNKQHRFTAPLLLELGLNGRAACVVSGDTTPYMKPHPAPLLHACRLLGVEPGACLYVGDAERDIQAGRAAGMSTLVALFGYLDARDAPAEWGADGMARTPAEVAQWLGGGGGCADGSAATDGSAAAERPFFDTDEQKKEVAQAGQARRCP